MWVRKSLRSWTQMLAWIVLPVTIVGATLRELSTLLHSRLIACLWDEGRNKEDIQWVGPSATMNVFPADPPLYAVTTSSCSLIRYFHLLWWDSCAFRLRCGFEFIKRLIVVLAGDRRFTCSSESLCGSVDDPNCCTDAAFRKPAYHCLVGECCWWDALWEFAPIHCHLIFIYRFMRFN